MAASRRVSSPTLVGRRDELASLRTVLDEIADGRPQVVVIGGESGVGKTRLVDEATAGLGDRVRVLRGQCLVFGAELPYLPFAEIIREIIRETDHDGIEELFGPAGPELAQFIPELGEAVGRSVPSRAGGSELQQLRLFESLLRLTERVADDRPTAFVFEDLQWIDAASLHLLAFLSQSIRRGAVALIVTIRTEALEANSPVRSLLAELERGPAALRIELERLDRADTRRQIAAILEDGSAATLADRVWEQGDGNPLFTEELVAASVDGDELGSPRLDDLIGARTARLSRAALNVLRVAAVLGRSIELQLLTMATGLDRAGVDRAMELGLEEQILVRTSERGASFRFRHELVRSVMAEQLDASEARSIHAAYAEALQARPEADPSEVAYHWDAADDTRSALRWHAVAGFDTEARYAYAAALRHYQRALELWAVVEDAEGLAGTSRLRILQRAATAAARAGEHERAITLARTFLDDTREEDDLAELVRSSLRWYLWEAGHPDEALAEARAAIARPFSPGSERWRANATAHLAGLLLAQGEVAEARSGAEEALRLAQAADAAEEQVLSNGIIGGCLLLEGEVDAGIDRISEALDGARRIELEDAALPADPLDDRRYPVGVVLASTQLAAAYEVADRPDDVVRVAEAAYARAAEQGVARTYGAILRAAGARALYRAGHWTEALSTIERTIQDGASGSGRVSLLAISALIHAARGSDAEADEALREAEEDAEAGTVAEVIHWLAMARAERLIWAGQPLEAVGCIAGAYDAGSEAARGAGLGRAIGVDASLPQMLSLAARAGADLALVERAEGAAGGASVMALERVRLAIDRARRRPGPAASWTPELALAKAELARAEHGPGSRSVAAWKRAAEAARERPYVEAYARWRLATALLADRRRADEAEAEIERATALAEELGARRLFDAIGALARHAGLGGSAVGRERERPFGLTKRELEVLGLLAAGLGNGAIAERLFISPKTASVHVSNIYGKLGVESRVAAANLAYQLGLATETKAPGSTTEE
jgi:DNA-binding CsgD family transcriptional regulator